MTTISFEQKTKTLIDDLKAVCAAYGLGNDGNEFKIITQVFLYKFMNDKFAYVAKQQDKTLAQADNWEEMAESYSEKDYKKLLLWIGPKTAKFWPRHYISNLFKRSSEPDFAKLLDDTLLDIATINNEIFSVKTDSGAKIQLFDRVSEYITDTSKRDEFCRALINKLTDFSFESIFDEKYDFFATIFEYLISDYNKDSGGKYAEYYTPHAVARIMADILVPAGANVSNVTCFDPSAGSGTLLMSLAHAIGEDKCTIYSQDISQKSSSLLRLNLILNNLVHSIQNIIQGNTIRAPYHKETFDYIVANPPFKLDFSDYSEDLDNKANKERFFAGIPNVPNKAKDKMAIYTLFIQHIMHKLSENGKAAIVLPTGFLTAQSGLDKTIRQRLVESRMLAGVVSMPSNIFATTGTNVSILFLDKSNKDGKVVLMDASKLGEKVKDGKNQKTVLTTAEEANIIATFNARTAVDDFTVAVDYDEIATKNYSLSAGQYFEIKIDYVDITEDEFKARVLQSSHFLKESKAEGDRLMGEILAGLEKLDYDK